MGEATCLCVWEFITHRPLDLCANDEDPVQLIIRPEWDAPHVSSFSERFLLPGPPVKVSGYDSRLSQRIDYGLEMHTRISGPDTLSTVNIARWSSDAPYTLIFCHPEFCF